MAQATLVSNPKRVAALMKKGKSGMQTIRRENLEVTNSQDRKIRRTLQEDKK